MKRFWYLTAITVLGVCAATFAGAAELSQAPEKPVQVAQVLAPPAVQPLGPTADISLDLRNIDIVDALKFLSMKAGMNIITTKSVSGRVTLMVENAPLQDVFDLMLRSNNLAYDRRGEIYNVMTQEEYKALYGKNFSDIRAVKVFYLKYAIPEQAFNLLDMLKSDVGRVLVDPESGNVLVMDAPARIQTMEEVLKEFEEKNTVRIFKLNYAKAKDVEEVLRTQLDTKKVGLIKADEKGNQLMVQTLPERMQEIASMIEQLDQKTKEIVIEVNIVQVKLANSRSQGVEWEGLFDISRDWGYTYLGSYPFSAVQKANDPWVSRLDTWKKVGYVGSYPFSGTTANPAAGSSHIGASELHFGVIGKQDFDVIFRYLETLGQTKIMSNPKIAVVNNQEAKIHVGQKEAYVTTTTTTGQTTNTVSEQVTFVDIGVMFSVVPVINHDGFISLKVRSEISSVVDTLVTPTKNEIPIIDTSLAETTVLVKDGSTVIIGGLRKEQNTEVTRQTPILGSIPLLGNLFKVNVKTKDKTELLIILTPHLITGEVFVNPSSGVGKKAGESGLKPVKDYQEQKNKLVEEDKVSDKIFLPTTNEKKLQMKGLRQRSR